MATHKQTYTCVLQCSPASVGLAPIVFNITADIEWSFTHVGCFCPASIFTDIEECELENHACNCSVTCTDTDGNFNCTCREGFEINGFNCTGIEISMLLIPCRISISCKHHVYACFMSSDIPESKWELGDCDSNVNCMNTKWKNATLLAVFPGKWGGEPRNKAIQPPD